MPHLLCTPCYLLDGVDEAKLAKFIHDGHSFCTDHLELWLSHDPAAYRMRAGGSRLDMLSFVAHLKAQAA